MYITVLIAAPAALDEVLVKNLAVAWGATDTPVWLSPDEAAEFSISVLPDNQWDVWADLQKARVDLVIVPVARRRKRLLLADMDSTMIRQECIDELAAEAGFGEQVSAITARAMNGELDFEAALNERVNLLKGVKLEIVKRVSETRVTYTPGGAELIATMRGNGAYTALVSGGFTDFTHVVAQYLGFDEHRANNLLNDGQALTGKVALPILGKEAKVETLQKLSTRLGIQPSDVLAVGDGANDLGMLSIAGMGVALHAKPLVAAQSDLRINHGDLTALLYIQGYRRAEFINPADLPSIQG